MIYRIVILLSIMVIYLSLSGQNERCDYILESRYRNPIDTIAISRGKNPSAVLFVHSNCKNPKCATAKMMRALQKDTLNILKNNNIDLYVVYPHYSIDDIADFDVAKSENSMILFDTNGKYYHALYGTQNVTPIVVLFDGKGNKWIKVGGLYDDLCDSINSWLKLK